MLIPTPINPLWPGKEECWLPIVQPFPLIDPNGPWLSRVWSAMTARPKYITIFDYFTYIPDYAWVYLPKNFVYDFASVPRVLTPFFEPTGIWAYPAGPHDFGYRYAGLLLSIEPGRAYRFYKMSRRDIDRIFLRMANKANNLPGINYVGAKALRAAGWLAYGPRLISQADWSKPVHKWD